MSLELGWVDIKNGLVFPGGPNCTMTGDGTPQLFRAHVRGGTEYCTDFGKITPNQSYGMGIDDAYGDQNWYDWYNGSQLGGSVGMDFSLGDSDTNGERWGTAESADASFNGLQYMPLNGTWTSWGAAGCLFDNDSNVGNYIHSAIRVDVQGTSNCPQ